MNATPVSTQLGNTALPGHVHLTVTNLTQELVFYQQSLGLKLRHMTGGVAHLGTEDATLLVLSETPDAPFVRRTTGLYHFALLLPSRVNLAEFTRHLLASRTPVQGTADHLVSEAIYLSDPEGNGIEVYADRPRQDWQRTANGGLVMDTLPLDLSSLLAEDPAVVEPYQGMPDGTRLGHVHLHVADLARSISFYRKVIGLDLMMQMGNSAGFLSAGGYHHHLGVNTWQGIGAPPPPPDAAGLQYYSLRVRDMEALDGLIDRLQTAETAYQPMESAIFLRDPSQNGVLFTLQDKDEELILLDAQNLLIQVDLSV